MNTERTNIGLGYWIAWVLASIIGFGAGSLLGMHVAYGLFDRDVFDWTLGVVLGTVMGATGGFLQWVVLREKIAGTGWWILASTLGFAVAGGILGAIRINENYVLAGVLFATVFGIAAGIMQWLVIRQQVIRAGLWVIASILGSLVGAIGVPAADAVSAATNNYDLSTMAFGLLFGAGLGVITGAVLIWLLRQSTSSNIEGMATAH